MQIDLNKVVEVTKEDFSSVEELAKMSKSLSDSYTYELDEVMNSIKTNLMNSEVPTEVLQNYLLSLTNAIYFTVDKSEKLGLFEDYGKASAKESYNDAYMKNALSESNEKKKTVAELTAMAEKESTEKSVASWVYSRASKIVKGKLDAADTMVSVLNNIIKRRGTVEYLERFSDESSKVMLGDF